MGGSGHDDGYGSSVTFTEKDLLSGPLKLLLLITVVLLSMTGGFWAIEDGSATLTIIAASITLVVIWRIWVLTSRLQRQPE